MMESLIKKAGVSFVVILSLSACGAGGSADDKEPSIQLLEIAPTGVEMKVKTDKQLSAT